MKKFNSLFVFSLLACASALAQTKKPGASDVTVLDETVVSGSPLARSAFDLAQPVSVLSNDKLALKMKLAPTLGETLRGEPGVSSSNFAAGASRPIIRGLDNNRVLVLNNGADILDVSNLSPDHAPSVNPLISQKIEVVRGAATILYGSSAIGGVVNVLDNRIPTVLPANGVSGEFSSRYDTNNSERSTALAVDTALSKHWVLHLDGSISKTDDMHIPGYALSDRIRAGLTQDQMMRGSVFGGDPYGYVPNTGVFTRDFGIGASYVWDRGYVGASFSQFLSYYGTPDDPEVDDPTTVPERVHIDMTKRQYSLRGAVTDPLPHFTSGNFKFTYTDYKHNELDGDTVGSTFKTNGFDSRVELVHEPIGKFEGSIGAQLFHRDLSVLGDSGSFLQPTHTWQAAFFVFEEMKLTSVPLRLQLGARVEYNSVSIDSNDPALTSLQPGQSTKREFVPLSAAAGLIYDITPDTNAALTVRYSERAPTAEELYARGSHDATFQYIVGDATLPKEKVLGIDLSLRKRTGVVTGSISGYYNRFYDFIDFTPTGDTVDGLAVYNYAKKSADFYGAEVLLDFHLLPQSITVPAAIRDGGVKSVVDAKGASGTAPNPHDLYIELKGDYVHAQNLTDDQPLPRITPLRYTAALAYQGEQLGARVEVERVEGQSRVAANETTTAGYTFLNANVSYSFQKNRIKYDFYVRGSNLTNAEGRAHESFLKDVMPLAGRSVVFGMRMAF